MIVAQFYCAQNPAYRPIRHYLFFSFYVASCCWKVCKNRATLCWFFDPLNGFYV